MDEMVPPFTVGHHDPKRPLPVTLEYISRAHAAGYDLVTSPITTPHFHSRVLTQLSGFLSKASDGSQDEITSLYNASPVQVSPLSPEDTPLTPDDSIGQTIGVTSSWIDLTSPDPVIADISAQVLKLEIAYAAFCGLTYVIVHGPRLRGAGVSDTNVAQYARAILDALGQGLYMQLFIWLPMIDHVENETPQIGDLAPFARAQFVEDLELESRRMVLFGTWEAWDSIRSMCKYSTRLSVALSVPRLLPPSSVQSRWYSEPVRMLTLHANAFTKNAKGYPVLSKAHQTLVTRFVHFKQPATWFLLCDVGQIQQSNGDDLVTSNPTSFPTPAESSASSHVKDPTPHLSYMRNLQNKQPAQSAADRFGAGYQDYLQAPLQPLTVHLESITYEVFEKDPIKYEWYERAIARALHDWVELGKPTSNPDGRVVVAVVGAGRGPLVTRALRASEAVGVDIDLWALEKNPNAFVLLQRTNQNVWNHSVSLVKSDMRTWKGPARQATTLPVRKLYNIDDQEGGEDAAQNILHESGPDMITDDQTSADTQQIVNYKIDILISELLGSFADNELSPECLDGVQHLLNPSHGTSIPASYTAHITPIAAPKLHADISLTMTNSTEHAAEIPYVVMLNAIDFLSTDESSRTAQGAEPDNSISVRPIASPQTYSAVTSQQVPMESSTSFSNKPGPPTAIIHQTWAFHHPNPELPAVTAISATATSAPSNSHNARHCSLTFPVPHRGTCHGLGGYFETVLYRGVELSTNPLTMESKSEGMISWFPIFFPLKRPLFIPDNATVTVQMWRQTDDRKVWYEWIVEVFITASEAYVDTKTGETKHRSRKIKVGASEVHSSEKEGCLM